MAEKEDDKLIDIPIQQTDLVMFNASVSSIKEKFIAEIKKMDEEMNKFSSDLMRLNAQSSSLHAEMAAACKSFDKQSPSKGHNNWESIANSPLVEGEGKNKTLKLQFDVSQFDPKEVTVKVQNEMLVISACHEEICDSNTVLRQYYREFKFPKGVDPCAIKTTLSKDGVLTVQAPLPQLAITNKSGRCSPKIEESQ